MARVSGPVSGLPLPRKSRGRVRSVCVREGVNKHKCENTQSINTHPRERKTRHWLESGSPVPPPGLLHPLSGSQAVLPQPAAAEFSGLVQDCCNRTASWLTAAMPVLLKHSYHVTTRPENSNFSAYRTHPSLMVLPSLDQFSQHASFSQIRPCTLLPPTCGLCSHTPWLLGVALDRKTEEIFPVPLHLTVPIASQGHLLHEATV